LLHFFVCTQLVLRARTPTELQFANRLNPPLTEPSLHAPQMVDINKLQLHIPFIDPHRWPTTVAVKCKPSTLLVT
jgi:hypothetical protein